METNDWVPRMEALEEDVKELKAALLGTLDGKPGLRAQMDSVIHLARQNNEQLDGLRLDKAKVVGIVIATGAIVGFGVRLLHL